MNIYYQGEPGSYSHIAAKEASGFLNCSIEDIVGLEDFDSVWNEVSTGAIGILPVENSYAGSIHQNVYNFLSYDHKIIGEYNFEVKHCLLSLENDISKVKRAYSHHQALSQVQRYLKDKEIIPRPYSDTAGAAKMIAEKQKHGVSAVASELAGEIYNLNILERGIEDQKGNTTKFLIITQKEKPVIFTQQKGRVTILFNIESTPGDLYECLGVFKKYGINMTKIESIPMPTGHFRYSFWITFEGSTQDTEVQDSLKELSNFTQELRILGEY